MIFISFSYLKAMSFGGSVSAMIQSLKMNKRDRNSILKQRKDLKGTKKNLTSLINKKASEEEMAALRLRLENKKNRRVRMQMVFAALSLAIVVFLYFLIFT